MSFAFMPLYTGDYIRDTQHLSCSEHGIFLKLLMHCWDQKGPAPLDERKLCGIVNARSSDEIEAMRRVLAEFFVRMQDGHYNKRMQQEIERSEAISGARSQAGKLGAATRAKQLPSKSRAIAKQEPLPPPPPPHPPSQSSQQPQDKTQQPPGPTGPREVSSHRFDALWAVYPRKVGKDAARKAFDKRKPDDALVALMIQAVTAQRSSPQWIKEGGQFIPHLSTWLNEGRWQDEAQPPAPLPQALPAIAKRAAIEAHNNAVTQRYLSRLQQQQGDICDTE